MRDIGVTNDQSTVRCYEASCPFAHPAARQVHLLWSCRPPPIKTFQQTGPSYKSVGKTELQSCEVGDDGLQQVPAGGTGQVILT